MGRYSTKVSHRKDTDCCLLQNRKLHAMEVENNAKTQKTNILKKNKAQKYGHSINRLNS